MAKVLIADDSAVARQTLRQIITSLGHSVVSEVPNGSQAFVEYTKLKPDVVTMDLTMQGLGGAEATSKIIATCPEAKIIVISAMEERRVVIDALERGARHFIIKPISKAKVEAVLNNVLQQDFDLKKHMERVRQIKSLDDQTATLGTMNQFTPPYFISAQEGNLVHVFINQNISLISCRSLDLELEEYLTDQPRVLFDFGAMVKLDHEILAKVNEMAAAIQSNSGMVRAISNDKKFVDSITKAQLENTPNVIGSVLRYFET